ncbi:MAG: nitroreductase family protein [Bdellovibrionaceae bacterium]|nr:nitroreductase family protein [Pseudobdellovibrionaceae bacterium]
MDGEEFLRLAKARKSIRKFKNEVPPRELIEKVLEAGIEAPSGKNRQNWRFFVVSGAKRDEYLALSQKSWLGIKDILQKRLMPSLYEFTERFFFTLGGAPWIIFAYSHNTPEEKYLTSVGSVYMAVENINLACVAYGLGCCTMGAPLEIKKEVDEFLGVTRFSEYQSGELELLCAIAIGYPDHDPPKAQRQLEGRIYWISNSSG